MMSTQSHHHHRSKAFNDLAALLLNIIRSPPPPFHFSDQPHAPMTQITPAGFASLLLGVSLSLMLCGSLTFFIGFLLMPWVLALLVFFYFLGLISTLFMIGRSIFSCNSSPASPGKYAATAPWKML